ncbi:MAG: fasciclin domain-containing protein [Allosphingosinicella sp.]
MRNPLGGSKMALKSMIAAACFLAAACSQQSNDPAGNGSSAATANQAASAGAGQQAKQSIAKGLAATPGHGKFVDALKAAGLDVTLSGAQPYTVFAPTDSAFEKLESGGSNALTAHENKAGLVALLTGHIVPGTVTAEDLAGAIDRGKGKAQIATVGGGTLAFTRSGDFLVVEGPDGNQARLGAETLQSNGIVHSLDTVLMPK